MPRISYALLAEISIWLNNNRDVVSNLTANKARSACVQGIGKPISQSTFRKLSTELKIEFKAARSNPATGLPKVATVTSSSRAVSTMLLKVMSELDDRLAAIEAFLEIESIPLGTKSGIRARLGQMAAGATGCTKSILDAEEADSRDTANV